jgi:hypothetical protein
MNKLGFMTLAGFAISFMMVMASFAADTGGSLGYSGSAVSAESLGISSGSSSGTESEEGSPAMSSDWDSEYGIAPEYRGTDFDSFSEGMSSDQDRDYGVYAVTPDKDPNAPY